MKHTREKQGSSKVITDLYFYTHAYFICEAFCTYLKWPLSVFFLFCKCKQKLKDWVHEKTKLCRGRVPRDFSFTNYRPECRPCKSTDERCGILKSTFPVNAALSSKVFLDCLATFARKLDASSRLQVSTISISVLDVMTNILDKRML